MNRPPYVAVLASLAISVSLFLIVSRSCKKSAARYAATQAHQVVGAGVAEELAKRTGGKAAIVILSPGAGWESNAVFQTPVQDFQRAALQHKGLEILATEPVNFGGAHTPQPLFSGQEFSAMLAKYPEADTFVSFAGPPALTAVQASEIKQKQIHLIIVERRVTTGLKELLTERLVECAIELRTPPGDVVKAPRTPAEWFTHYWQVITPDTASSLPN